MCSSTATPHYQYDICIRIHPCASLCERTRWKDLSDVVSTLQPGNASNGATVRPFQSRHEEKEEEQGRKKNILPVNERDGLIHARESSGSNERTEFFIFRRKKKRCEQFHERARQMPFSSRVTNDVNPSPWKHRFFLSTLSFFGYRGRINKRWKKKKKIWMENEIAREQSISGKNARYVIHF